MLVRHFHLSQCGCVYELVIHSLLICDSKSCSSLCIFAFKSRHTMSGHRDSVPLPQKKHEYGVKSESGSSSGIADFTGCCVGSSLGRGCSTLQVAFLLYKIKTYSSAKFTTFYITASSPQSTCQNNKVRTYVIRDLHQRLCMRDDLSSPTTSKISVTETPKTTGVYHITTVRDMPRACVKTTGIIRSFVLPGINLNNVHKRPCTNCR